MKVLEKSFCSFSAVVQLLRTPSISGRQQLKSLGYLVQNASKPFYAMLQQNVCVDSSNVKLQVMGF